MAAPRQCWNPNRHSGHGKQIDPFKHYILPDKIHMLNVSFLVPEMRRKFSGCAGNIAYNLKLLGGEPIIMATIKKSFGVYAERLDTLGISREAIRNMAGSFTAQAFITTDLADNQITAFHPGAMFFSHENDASKARDIGLGMPLFSGSELLEMLELADHVTLNDYEAELSLDALAAKVKAWW